MEVFEVRLMDPGYLNRIALFTGTRFSWHKTNPDRLLLSLIQHYVIISITVFLIGTAIPSPTLAQVQLETTIPNLGRQQLMAGESGSAESPLLTIYNPRNRTIPVSEVQTIYLSACKVVEQQRSRTGPVGPRLRLRR